MIDPHQSHPHSTALDPQFAYSVSHQIAKWDVREWNDDVARHRGKRVRYSVDLASLPARPSSSTSCPVLYECEHTQSNDPSSPVTLTRSSTSIFLRPSKERARLPSTSSAFFAASASSPAPPAPPPSEDGQDETSGSHNTRNKPPSWSIFSDGAAMEDAFSRLTHGDTGEGSSAAGGWDPPRKMDPWAERYDRASAWAYCSGGRAGESAGDAMTEDGEPECLSLPSPEGCRKTRGSKRRLERDGDEDGKSDGEGWQVVEPFAHDPISRPPSPTLSSFASTSSLPVSPPPFRGQDPDVDIESVVDIDGDLEMRLPSNAMPMFPDSPLAISISILNNNTTPTPGTLPAVPESLWSQPSRSPFFSRSPLVPALGHPRPYPLRCQEHLS
ncbi:hypothetical protein BS47DRAFT_1382073 [Hydnum rufescens UP504]|uniref:Uncharacterized protein n=1 Tax=Hydnum rufescens UP504 TaxID=1448309 RepID=A0A9P6AYR7_9AGAM|nr:hypothetical protein BS47DRAFT_1382073 [Hydnum rufescens UP504]